MPEKAKKFLGTRLKASPELVKPRFGACGLCNFSVSVPNDLSFDDGLSFIASSMEQHYADKHPNAQTMKIRYGR